jgi:hypothetical protein
MPAQQYDVLVDKKTIAIIALIIEETKGSELTDPNSTQSNNVREDKEAVLLRRIPKLYEEFKAMFIKKQGV